MCPDLPVASLNRTPASTVSAKSVLGSGDPDKLVQLCVWPSAGQGRTVTRMRLKNKMGILLPGTSCGKNGGRGGGERPAGTGDGAHGGGQRLVSVADVAQRSYGNEMGWLLTSRHSRRCAPDSGRHDLMSTTLASLGEKSKEVFMISR